MSIDKSGLWLGPLALGAAGPFDLHQLNEVTGGDPKTTRRYLELFARLTTQSLDLLRAAIENRDPAQTRALAHKIKGSGAMIGATGVSAAAADLERIADSTDDASLRLGFERLMVAFAEAVESGSGIAPNDGQDNP